MATRLSTLLEQLSVESLQVAIDAMPVGLLLASLDGEQIFFANQTFTQLFGYEVRDLPSAAVWLEKYPVETERALIIERLCCAAACSVSDTEALTHPIEVTIRCKDGSDKTVLHGGVAMRDQSCILGTFVDITARKKQEVFLREAEQRAREADAVSRMLLEHANEMVVISLVSGTRYVSPAVEQITGWTPEEYLSKDLNDLIHPDDREAMRIARKQVLEQSVELTLRYRSLQKGGGFCWVEASARAYRRSDSTESLGYVATIRDISKQKQEEEHLALRNDELVRLAQLDELTGIANRRVFNNALLQESRRKGRSSHALSVLLLDIDHFKPYNDIYGHLQGDACLRQIAQVLNRTLHRVADLVARFGGEEFVMLLPMTDADGALLVAENVLKAVADLRIPHRGSSFGIITVSIGVSTWLASDILEEQLLLQEADRALYRAKSQGRNRYCVAPVGQISKLK